MVAETRKSPTRPSDRRLTCGRVRLGEAEAQAIYPALYAAEKAALLDYVQARDAGDPGAPTLRARQRRIETVRRKVLALIEEMDWNRPFDG